MPLEIERKFLIANSSWESSVIRSIRIRDGLIASNNGHKARVRISDAKANITLKSRRLGSTRTEFEYAIPYSDAEEILRTMCDGHVLNKTRHFVTHLGAIWYVDVYDGILNGVVLAEIELESADQQIELPGWIGKEVTGDPSYRKVNLLAQRIAALGENGSSRQIIGAAPTMIGRQKTEAELNAEAKAEALLKKAQSKFYSLE